jgi:hypothetical protein
MRGVPSEGLSKAYNRKHVFYPASSMGQRAFLYRTTLFFNGWRLRQHTTKKFRFRYFPCKAQKDN